jgi:hypothetical protein
MAVRNVLVQSTRVKQHASHETYLFVRQGYVQHMMGYLNGELIRIWPVALTHADAMRVCRWSGAPDIRPLLIGAVQGETLEGHIALAFKKGAAAAVCPLDWDPDGAPVWGVCNFRD